MSFDGATTQVSREARLPLSAVDGISPKEISELKRLDVDDVSVLATSNPLYLFCETRFGIYQIMDWIGQAQLLAAVGEQHARQLRRLGITNLHSLKEVHQKHPPALEAISAAMRVQYSDVALTVDAMTSTPHFQRTEMLRHIPPAAMEMLLDAAQKVKDNNPNRIWHALVDPLQRVVYQSTFIVPCSLIVVVWSVFQIWFNFVPAIQVLADLALPSAVAQEVAQTKLFMSQTLQSLIMLGIASSILITLVVCLYAGFIAKKPSSKAAELVKSILSFAFGIMTGSITTGR